jgi:hypothetical protein
MILIKRMQINQKTGNESKNEGELRKNRGKMEYREMENKN